MSMCLYSIIYTSNTSLLDFVELLTAIDITACCNIIFIYIVCTILLSWKEVADIFLRFGDRIYVPNFLFNFLK